MFVPRAGPVDRTARAGLTNQIRLRPLCLRRCRSPQSPLRLRADAAFSRWASKDGAWPLYHFSTRRTSVSRSRCSWSGASSSIFQRTACASPSVSYFLRSTVSSSTNSTRAQLNKADHPRVSSRAPHRRRLARQRLSSPTSFAHRVLSTRPAGLVGPRLDRRNVVPFELLCAVLTVRQDLDAPVRLQAHSHPSLALVRLGPAAAILTLHRVCLADFRFHWLSQRETHKRQFLRPGIDGW
jgi:hypothetical protein